LPRSRLGYLRRGPRGGLVRCRARTARASTAAARSTAPWEAEQERNGLTCDQWADRYLTRVESGALRTKGGRTYKASSVDTARSALRAFRAEFGDRPLGSVARPEAIDWAERVPASKVPIVVTLFELAVSEERIGRNPFRGLSRRTRGRRDDHPPTAEELDALLEACDVLKDYAARMRALLIFAAYSGMRPGELFALEWPDVDLASNRVHVRRRLYRGRVDLPKSNRERTIALMPPARDALLTLPEREGLVFRAKRGGGLCQPLLTEYWGRVCARAGLDFDFYLASKHRCVHYMKVTLRLPNHVIAAQMGWSERSVEKMVETYAHSEIGALAEIDAAWGTVPQQAENVVPLRTAAAS
jgi:integrase